MKKPIIQITTATLLRDLDKHGKTLDRRKVLKGIGALTGVAWLAGCAQPLTDDPAPSLSPLQAARLPTAATGANVDESRVVNTYYVSPNGSDDNSGSKETPFQTVGHAVQVALANKANNLGVKVVLADGTYREAVTVNAPADGDTEAPLVIEATTPGKAVLSGSDEWRGGWSREGNTWAHEWLYKFGLSPSERYTSVSCTRLCGPVVPELCRRRELVFVNGQALRQVLLADELDGALEELSPYEVGAFCVDEAAEVIYVRLQDSKVDLNNVLVEVAVRPSTMLLQGLQNVVLRGLTFQHANGFQDDDVTSLRLLGCINFLVEDCAIHWNNNKRAVGITNDPGRDGTLRRVNASHNGVNGLHVTRQNNLLVEDCETSYNNFRGDWAKYYSGWVGVAFKVQNSAVTTWRRHVAIGNAGRGMWWDTGNSDIIVEDSFMHGNLLTGLFIEHNPGPALARRCIITGTRLPTEGLRGKEQPGGLSVSTSADVTLESNISYDNEPSQFRVWGTLERTDPLGNTNRPERQTYRHNVFVGTSAEQLCYYLPGKEPREDGQNFGFFYDSLLSDENLFFNPVRADVFLTHLAVDEAPEDRSTAIYRDLQDWQEYSGQDENSLFFNPRFANPERHNFQPTGRSAKYLRDWDLPRRPPRGR